MKKIYSLFILIGFLTVGQSGWALPEPDPIDGTYRGSMQLIDGKKKTEIPLAIVLFLSDELKKVEVSPGVFEMMKVLDGNFLVDKEGGPFAFTQVTYRLNTSEIDLRYSRTKGVTVGQPSSFRLVGKVKMGGKIVGRVLSGFKGDIGKFTLTRTDTEPLAPETQFQGIWSGLVELLPEGDIERLGISIADTGLATLNPDQFEFDYTPGKIGFMDFSVIQQALSNVVIDYLHRRVVLSDSGAGGRSKITVEAILDPKTNKLKGYFSSIYGGRRGAFNLSKISEEVQK